MLTFKVYSSSTSNTTMNRTKNVTELAQVPLNQSAFMHLTLTSYLEYELLESHRTSITSHTHLFPDAAT
jgi:hypothetical protein